MTFIEKFKKMLTERGMFESQAEKVMARVVTDKATESMEGRWNDDADGYPPQMIAILWMSVRRNAVEFIDDHCPAAWFRPVFEDAPIPPLAREEEP